MALRVKSIYFCGLVAFLIFASLFGVLPVNSPSTQS